MILSIILFYNGKVKIIDVAKCSGSLCKNFDVILVEKCSFLFIIYSFIYLKHLLYLKMVWKLSREHCLHSGVSFYFSPLLLSSNANVPFSLFKERKKSHLQSGDVQGLENLIPHQSLNFTETGRTTKRKTNECQWITLV